MMFVVNYIVWGRDERVRDALERSIASVSKFGLDTHVIAGLDWPWKCDEKVYLGQDVKGRPYMRLQTVRGRSLMTGDVPIYMDVDTIMLRDVRPLWNGLPVLGYGYKFDGAGVDFGGQGGGALPWINGGFTMGRIDGLLGRGPLSYEVQLNLWGRKNNCVVLPSSFVPREVTDYREGLSYVWHSYKPVGSCKMNEHMFPFYVEVLKPWCADRGPLSILEIGTHIGSSVAWFLRELDVERIVCVDDFSNSLEGYRGDEALSMWRRRFCNERRVSLHIGYSWEVGGEFDVVLVDGGHSEQDVRADTRVAMQKCKGMIMFDDWSWDSVRAGASVLDDSWCLVGVAGDMAGFVLQ